MGAGGVSGRAIEVVPGGQARAEGRDAAGENRTRAGRESAGLAGMAMAGWVSPRLPAAATRLLPSDALSGSVASSMDLRSPSSRSGSPASNRPLHEARPLPPATLQSPARVRLRLLSDNGSLRHCRQPPRRPFSSSRHHQASVSPEQFRGGTLRQERARHQARQRCAAPTHSILVHMKLTLSRRPDMSPLTHPGRLSPWAPPLPAAAYYALPRKLPAAKAAPDAPARTRTPRDRLQALAQRALQEGRCV